MRRWIRRDSRSTRKRLGSQSFLNGAWHVAYNMLHSKCHIPSLPLFFPALYETNASEAKITEIQQALKSRGYYAGIVDGKLEPLTIDAVNAFEKNEGIPVDRFLNIDTVTALGVSPK